MTCRHSKGDPSCTTQYPREYESAVSKTPKTPDSSDYEIVDSVRVGLHLVLKVLYPNCKKCAYEGNKVMVFLNVSEADVLRWRKIDPHFRDPKASRTPKEAPPPAARFPASKEGWTDALFYANSKK